MHPRDPVKSRPRIEDAAEIVGLLFRGDTVERDDRSAAHIHPDGDSCRWARGGAGGSAVSGVDSREARHPSDFHGKRQPRDPATLSRDLAGLLTAGYRVEKMTLIDLFPQTYQLETVVRLRL